MDIRTSLTKKLLPLVPALLMPATALAQATGLSNQVTPPTGTFSIGLIDAIGIVLNGILMLAGIVALIYLIIGGVRYITSGGEETAVETAKNTILYAIIGLIVIALAAAAVNFILGTVIT